MQKKTIHEYTRNHTNNIRSFVSLRVDSWIAFLDPFQSDRVQFSSIIRPLHLPMTLSICAMLALATASSSKGQQPTNGDPSHGRDRDERAVEEALHGWWTASMKTH